MSGSHRTHHHVVILGGGITGLSAAFHLARKHPTTQITLIEKSTRFGGWVRSERVEVCDNDGNRGSVLLEAGPRTIRPNSKSILELIHLLDLRSQVLSTPRASPAGQNRFLHIPPTPGLQPLPSSILSAFTLPLGRLVLKSVLAEPFVAANRSRPPLTTTTTTTTTTASSRYDENEGGEDESIDSFFARRFGDAFARTLGSALVHGIYAADSRRLSVNAAFPALCASEARGNGSVVWGEIGPPAWFGRVGVAVQRWKNKAKGEEVNTEAWDTGAFVEDHEWEARIGAAALLSFRDGMETLVHALVKALRGFSNVTLRIGTAVRRISQDETHRGSLEVSCHRFYFYFYFICPYTCDAKLPCVQVYLDDKNSEDADAVAPLKATHVISTLPLPVLDSIIPSQPSTGALPHLNVNPLSTVTVINLVFAPAASETPLHPPGFGYLIPRPEQGYPAAESASTSSEPGLLGVVFDTASLPEQDDQGQLNSIGIGVAATTTTIAAARFIKLTAMLGGPYPLLPKEPDALLATVLPLISTQLGGRPLPAPVHYAVHRNEESIPTYLVGHNARMSELRRALRDQWGDRLKVIGAGVGGVSVADCVKAGRQAAFEIGTQIEAKMSSTE
ncbi:hypothetical protein B0F90DRAFT_1837216 [Multifurca ochricompacta]|uniref:Protoporphyrinogen oxidase n=1 Tax=Multifurca ochricompacta TaxID=376703 RepID=A0AAD4M7J3_9AGAM|nr:hypothetical protein B0F90DRAFT_1837216 [Multifurca ochricompacta]